MTNGHSGHFFYGTVRKMGFRKKIFIVRFFPIFLGFGQKKFAKKKKNEET